MMIFEGKRNAKKHFSMPKNEETLQKRAHS